MLSSSVERPSSGYSRWWSLTRITVSIELNSEPLPDSSTSTAGNASVVGGVIAPRPRPSEARAVDVRVAKGKLSVDLADGRTLTMPLERFPRLIEASPRERREFQLIGGGTLIHWPAVDEDIDVPNLLRA
jgi:hypothetical protein